MNLLEYQSKNLLARAGINVPAGMVFDDRMDVETVLSYLGFSEGVMKAQIPAGGRGLSGGIKFVHSAEEAAAAAKSLIGKRLATLQTGPNGIVVRKVLFEEFINTGREYYLGISVDSSSGVPVIIFSSEGGKSIEEVPEKVFKEPIDPLEGLTTSKAMEMAGAFGFDGKAALALAETIKRLFNLFSNIDALLIEINPLVFTEDLFVALDAKITIDDNALFRHPELLSLKEAKDDRLEQDAEGAGISYIRMDGDTGCLVNGAGLAMATIDMITFSGRKPANFLDIGGSAHHKQVSAALRILFSDPEVKVVFVNIFGGIVHCDLIASEILEAVRGLKPAVPVVIRLEGTGSDKGRKIIADSGLPIVMVSGMEEVMERIRNL